MSFLLEDATFLAGFLVVAAVICLLALKVTQQGVFLIWGLGALAAAGLALLVEWAWVTDNERVEASVYALADAVRSADVPRAFELLTDDVRFTRRGTTLPSEPTRALMADLVGNAQFDFLTIRKLSCNAGGQSRRGTAEFRVLAGGSIVRGGFTYNFGSTNSAWSLGLVERNGVWKVNRITPVELPRGGDSVFPRGS